MPHAFYLHKQSVNRLLSFTNEETEAQWYVSPSGNPVRESSDWIQTLAPLCSACSSQSESQGRESGSREPSRLLTDAPHRGRLRGGLGLPPCLGTFSWCPLRCLDCLFWLGPAIGPMEKNCFPGIINKSYDI